MPIYEFECRECGTRFEKLCGCNSTDIQCTGCGGGEVKKLFSMFAAHTRGSDGSSRSSSCSCGGSCGKSSCAGCHH